MISLHNLVALAIMMKVSKGKIAEKTRRLLAKAHISLHKSKNVFTLVDNVSVYVSFLFLKNVFKII